MIETQYDALIIGAGAAGLTAAKHLDQYKLKTLIVDQSDRVGGRLKTDEKDGFRFDHGFQVLLDGYPILERYLDLKALELQSFKSGAFCFDHQRSFLVDDINRNKKALLRMAFSPVGSLMDKIRIANMRAHITGKTIEEIFNEPEITTRDFLKQWKLSNRIIDRFFQPFFSGIFLENELETSARMFQFIFKMFSEGNACLPAKGIEAIAVQLKLSLAHASFRLNCKVKKVEKGLVTLEDGETIKAKQIIVATDAAELMPQLSQSVKWNSTQQLYFSADKTTLPKKYIALNFKKEGLINNLAVLSDVSPAYAPYEKKLISVCLRNSSRKAESELVQNVLDELATCLGAEVKKWHYLRGYQIKKALPIPADNAYEVPFEQSGILEGIYLAGDQMLNPSLNGAMLSGELAAKALILNHKSN